jgi:hypothetical protein
MEALDWVGFSHSTPLSILAEAFPARLSAFNELTREMREAGIAIKLLVLLDNRIFIEEDAVLVFLRHFGDQFSGVRYSPAGIFTCNCVTVRGVDVAWFTLVKEQDE